MTPLARMRPSLLRPALAAFVLACSSPAATQDQPPLPPSGIKGRGDAAANAVVSPDGAFRWVEGERFLTRFRGPGGTRPVRLRLPPGPEEGAVRRVLFTSGAPFFCVVDETRSEIGLHLQAVRGASKARAVIVRSVLKLVDGDGRLLWSRPMPDKHVVAEPAGTRALSVSRDGTLAVLLQDVDAHSTPQPILLVLDRKGKQRLQLDYTVFKRVDEFVLSRDGATLVVRGWGLDPDRETWGKTLAFYGTDGRRRSLISVPKASDTRRLLGVDDSGAACCVEEAGALFAVSPSGQREPFDHGRMAGRFGIE